MAWITLAKVLLILFCLTYLILNNRMGLTVATLANSLSIKVILIAILALASSWLWTEVDMQVALLTLVKHAKILVIPMLLLLIRTTAEARLGLIAFALVQTFVLLSSFLLAFGVPIFWVTNPIGDNVVFSSYLDQSIMMTTTAAVLWHLRKEQMWSVYFSVAVGSAALVDALFLLDGRTGYAVAVAMMTLAAMWALPRRLQIPALLAIPVLMMATLYLGSSHIQNRVSMIFDESKQFAQQVETNSSSGWRLNAWHRSIQGIKESPLYGHGIGSWTITVKRIEGPSGTQIFGEGNSSNPHQEYLLWGVQLGVFGALLFVIFLIAIAIDARRFRTPIRRAIWSVVVALAVASLFNSTLYDDLIGDFFCIVIGILLAMGFREGEEQNMANT